MTQILPKVPRFVSDGRLASSMHLRCDGLFSILPTISSADPGESVRDSILEAIGLEPDGAVDEAVLVGAG